MNWTRQGHHCWTPFLDTVVVASEQSQWLHLPLSDQRQGNTRVTSKCPGGQRVVIMHSWLAVAKLAIAHMRTRVHRTAEDSTEKTSGLPAPCQSDCSPGVVVLCLVASSNAWLVCPYMVCLEPGLWRQTTALPSAPLIATSPHLRLGSKLCKYLPHFSFLSRLCFHTSFCCPLLLPGSPNMAHHNFLPFSFICFIWSSAPDSTFQML